MGNIAGIVSPQIVGVLKDSTGSFQLGLATCGVPMIILVFLVPLLREKKSPASTLPQAVS